jgi:hypothetical protein
VNGVLLAQQDVHCLDLPTPIRYPPRAVSHFRYWRDNLLLLRVHAWLLLRGIFSGPGCSSAASPARLHLTPSSIADKRSLQSAVSSAVERLVYTELVGGSIPSPRTIFAVDAADFFV